MALMCCNACILRQLKVSLSLEAQGVHVAVESLFSRVGVRRPYAEVLDRRPSSVTTFFGPKLCARMPRPRAFEHADFNRNSEQSTSTKYHFIHTSSLDVLKSFPMSPTTT